MKSSFNQNMSFQVPKARIKGKTLPRECHLAIQDHAGCKDHQKVSLKRASPYGSSLFNGKTQNVEAEKAGKRQRVHTATFQKKVDTIVCPGEILSTTGMHDFLKERLDGYNDLERANARNVVTQWTLAESSEQYDSDDDACSVGSCSVNGSIKRPCKKRGLPFSDAESFCCSAHMKENCSCCLEEKLEGHIWRHALLLPML